MKRFQSVRAFYGKGSNLLLRISLFVLIVSLISITPLGKNPALAEQAAQDVSPEALGKEVARLSSTISSSRLDIDKANDAVKRLGEIKAIVDSCLQESQSELETINTSLQALGPKATGEAPEVTRERYLLLKKKAELEKRNGQCTVISLKVQPLKDAYEQKRKELAQKNLFYRHPNAIALFTEAAKGISSWPSAIAEYTRQHSGLGFIAAQPWLSAGGLLLAILLSSGLFALGSALAARLDSLGRPEGKMYGERISFLTARLAAALFFAAAAFITWLLQGRELGSSLLAPLLACIALFLSLLLLVGFMKQSETLCIHSETDDKPGRTGNGSRWWRLFSLLASLVVLFDIPPLSMDIPAVYLQSVHAILVPLCAISFLVSVLPCLKRPDSGSITRAAAWIIPRITLAIAVLQWIGFGNLARYIGFGSFCTYTSGILVHRFRTDIHRLLDDFASGKKEWAKKLREKWGIRKGETPKAVPWTKWFASVSLWGLWILSLLYFWSVSSTYTEKIYSTLFNGFSVGSVKIVPSRLFAAALAFTLLLATTSWIKQLIGKKLTESYISRSAAEALVTITGYLGFLLAFIIGLGIAGVALSDLAIIAGALSVGIGFGLQNIVNNFVSGIILLFEQPIKRGDWIVVGQTEGYVKKISVRSTVIQTFDRADVIVPNSELISGQVTNWMFGDVYGRLKIRVGVAYGSDTRLVEKILLEIANAHPMVVTDKPSMMPRVFFWEFGDSSLNFRLDIFLKDIDTRRRVLSEINFAIDEAFRKHGITIPFPQRDLHIK